MNKYEDVYGNVNIYIEISSKCKGFFINNRNLVREKYIFSYISVDYCFFEVTLELEVDYIYVCTERYFFRIFDELALEKGDIVEGLFFFEYDFYFVVCYFLLFFRIFFFIVFIVVF